MCRSRLAACGLTAGLLIFVSFSVPAENWPQWRGPAFNGSSPETGLPTRWSTNENRVWTVPLPGFAGSTPIVWGDCVFATSPDALKNLLLFCFNRKDGSVRWKKEVGTGDRVAGRNNMAAPSPVTDGERVIALFATGDLAAFDFEGKELWRRNLAREFGRFAHMWIYGSSPLLFQGRLFVQVLQRDTAKDYAHALDDKPERESYLLCIDPATGKTLWRHVRETDAEKESRESYATPLPFQGPNGWELVLMGGDYVTGHSPTDGQEFWRSAGLNPRETAFQRSWYRVVPSAVFADDLIVACGPKNQPVFAIKSGGKGGITESHRAWTCRDATSDWSTPLFYRNQLFVLDGGKRVLACLDPKTGRKKWSGNLGVPDQVWSSPTGADGKIYCLSERGTVVVLEAGNEFKVLATNSLGDDGPSRSSVVVSGVQLFIRTGKNLHCIGTRKP
ncbi:MAG: PQQ-like beta-propeller repeat protein [Verrucomicrobia bacterium]|nr:PQQ-like beta-propeller repeat protein [Verrucomicrobiota bacterium]